MVVFRYCSGDVLSVSLGIFFIKPVYSKIASCATKLGEFLSCGVPCITNRGIGDHNEILTNSRTGIVLNDFSHSRYFLWVISS